MGNSSRFRKWSQRTLRGTSLLVPVVALGAQSQAPEAELVRVYYDFEVASYCGLVSDRAGLGFVRERDRIMADHGIDDPGMQQARMQGWKEAHLEWQNRGLGGFKGWCRTEGIDARERFEQAPD
jgi:hypothetical protein